MSSQISAEILTQQELEMPRSAGNMLTWIDQAHGRFNTKQLKAEAREGRPMALFARRHFGATDAEIKPGMLRVASGCE